MREDNNKGKTRREIVELSFCYQKLTGSPDLSDFVNLKGLNCSNNQLTSLVLSGCENVVVLNCSDNQLTSVDFLNALSHPEKLESLLISSNIS